MRKGNEMGQRKLTKDETELIRVAKVAIGQLSFHYEMYRTLGDILYNGTTDGKPYVEPQPEIGEGYREATEADKDRKDMEFWNCTKQRWCVRAASGVRQSLAESYHYRVPIDRIPTDDDARERPLVMVRDFDGADWIKRPLLAVTDSDKPFVVKSRNVHTAWKFCRFPYPGEADQ